MSLEILKALAAIFKGERVTAEPGPATIKSDLHVAPPAGDGVPADFRGRAVRIDNTDIFAAAGALGCEVAAVRAVIAVEAAGSGFLPDGRPKILFEAHVFSRETQGRFDVSHPRVSSPVWNRLLYAGRAGEYTRLAEAIALDRKAALRSASWGLFQIMGNNHDRCGYGTVNAFVAAMCDDEANHLHAFMAFCRSGGLDRHLRSKDWASFARGYNGANYAANRYDTKLAAAYEQAKR